MSTQLNCVPLLLIVVIILLVPSAAMARGNQFHNDAIRAGWYGIFPQIPGYVYSFSRPIVKYRGYSQTARYTSTDDPDTACDVTVGVQHIRFGETAQARPLTWKRMDSLSAEPGKVILFQAYGTGWKNPDAFVKSFKLDKIAKAVSDLPRQIFTVTKSTFAALPAKPTYEDLVDWLGTPDEDIGSGIHIMVFPLVEGGRALIGTPDLKNVFYVRLQSKEETDKWQEP